MPRCDVCSAPISADEVTKEYTADEFQRMVLYGFEPDDKMIEFAEAMGAQRSTAVTEWKMNVHASKTGWLLCPSCTERAERFVKTMPTKEELAANATKYQESQKKSFWKKLTDTNLGCIALIVIIVIALMILRIIKKV